MQAQTDLLLYRFRFLLAGMLITAFLVALSAVVTAVGSNSILATKSAAATHALDVNAYSDSPNVVTAGASKLADGSQYVLISTGTVLYGTCRAITTISSSAGRGVLHVTGFIFRGIGSGIGFVGRGVGSVVMFGVSLPGKAVGSVGNTHAVGNIIRPSEDNPVPTISTELSPAMLAKINAQAAADAHDQQTINAQVAANRSLEGTIVAGDPHHGGYPTKWDNARQDSLIDSWGMFNRECVSYTAWKVYQTYGSMPFWGGVGNANQWPRDARNSGIPTGSVPKAHSVAVSLSGYYGHAMWVEQVNGNMIYVSQYNYDYNGHYSEMWVNGSYFTYIYFK
jgi:surface antigen